jgi:ParG
MKKNQGLNELVASMSQKSENKAVEEAKKRVKCEEETKMLQIIINKELHKVFKAAVADDEESMTSVIERLINDYLSKRK